MYISLTSAQGYFFLKKQTGWSSRGNYWVEETNISNPNMPWIFLKMNNYFYEKTCKTTCSLIAPRQNVTPHPPARRWPLSTVLLVITEDCSSKRSRCSWPDEDSSRRIMIIDFFAAQTAEASHRSGSNCQRDKKNTYGGRFRWATKSISFRGFLRVIFHREKDAKTSKVLINFFKQFIK